MWTPEINQMLDDIVAIDQYDEKRKLACVCIVERMLVLRENGGRVVGGHQVIKGTNKNFGPGKWNQKRTKYECSCGNCGTFLDVGAVCWVTVGESPRCLDCGRPPAEQPVEQTA